MNQHNPYKNVTLKLKQIESLLFDLEKAYFRTSPLLEDLINKTTVLINELKKDRLFYLALQLFLIRSRLMTIRKKLRYDPALLQDIFKKIDNIQDNNYNLISSQKNNQQDLSRKKSLEQFLIVKDNDIFFIIHIKKKIYQHTINTNQNVIKAKVHITGNNVLNKQVYLFESLGLPTIQVEKKVKPRCLLLLENTDSVIKGLMVDQVDRMLYMDIQLFRKKITSFSLGDKQYRNYIPFQGEKLFIAEV